MEVPMSLFRKPKEKNYDVLLAESRFVNDVLVAIESAMESRALTQAKLADLLGISEARVSQLLSGNGVNLRARTIARVGHAMNLRPEIKLVELRKREQKTETKLAEKLPQSFAAWAALLERPNEQEWEDCMEANDNQLLAVA
jgi:transcriptional regulator with XRE-family HTH domain